MAQWPGVSEIKQWIPGTNREAGVFGNSELHGVRPDEVIYT